MSKESTTAQGANVGGVKSADRVLRILEFVARNGPQRFEELVRELGLPRSSAHGLLAALTAASWLVKASDRRFHLGVRAWEVGRQYTGHASFLEVAVPLMDGLSANLGETVQLARLDGVHNIYIAISHSSHPMRLASAVGVRLPAHGTAIGKALLAQLSPAEVNERIGGRPLEKMTEHTITDARKLVAEVDAVRIQGFATDVEEYAQDCICVATPVGIDPASNEPFAISVTAPTSRRPSSWPDVFLQPLAQVAAELRLHITG